jgi:hypothetical protein
MNGQAFRIARYRLRGTFVRRSAGYLSIVLLIGLIGGIAMSSIQAGRRTQSSYPTFLASTNPSDLTVTVYDSATGGGAGPNLTATLAQLAHVRRVAAVIAPAIVPLAADGSPRLSALGDVNIGGSLDGLFFNQDRVTAVQGRIANPDRADEMVMDARAAQLLGVHVGQVVPMGFYTNAQTNAPGFGTPRVAPRLRLGVKLVGIAVANGSVIQDDVDRAYGSVVMTPAYLRKVIELSPSAGSPILYGLQLDHGSRDVSAVEQEVAGVVPGGLTYEFHVSSHVVSEVELAVKPESVALGGFGAIAALVCLVLAVQAISRQLRWGDEDRQVLRALGAGPVASGGDRLIGLLGAAFVGSVAAAGVAIGLSPLSPLGPVRSVYPDRGVAVDWTVIGGGLAVLVVVLAAATVLLSFRGAPHRVARTQDRVQRSSGLIRRAEAAGLPAAGVVGLRFALEPGRGRTAVPVRSALVGTVLAVAVVVATLTFASSLHTLVSDPPLFGWNWTYALAPSNDVPPQALKLLGHDPDVAAWTGVNYTNAEIDGLTIPFLFSRPRDPVAPPILSGHGLDANDQIVLGAASLAELHKRVGDTVEVSYGSRADAPVYLPPTRLSIVGIATFPAVGYASFIADHTSMGTGALISQNIFPPAFQRATESRDPILNGPELVFVRMRAGMGATAGRADMQRIARAADKAFAADPEAGQNSVSVLGVLRPAQIVNYRSIGSTPVFLAVGLAAGAIVALALTLMASVRRRRRDLALLKALGFSPRQLAASVAWQATVGAVIGIVAGVPIGIVAGRELWTLFAHNLDAVPDPTVPVLSVLLVCVGALVFANLVAALPGRQAARTPTALLLRTE